MKETKQEQGQKIDELKKKYIGRWHGQKVIYAVEVESMLNEFADWVRQECADIIKQKAREWHLDLNEPEGETLSELIDIFER